LYRRLRPYATGSSSETTLEVADGAYREDAAGGASDAEDAEGADGLAWWGCTEALDGTGTGDGALRPMIRLVALLAVEPEDILASWSSLTFAKADAVDPLLLELLPKLSFHFDGFFVIVGAGAGAGAGVGTAGGVVV
jgi:hypothetical protein